MGGFTLNASNATFNNLILISDTLVQSGAKKFKCLRYSVMTFVKETKTLSSDKFFSPYFFHMILFHDNFLWQVIAWNDFVGSLFLCFSFPEHTFSC